MEETHQSSTDHRGLKLQNIIQKLSEHCDIKNPDELESVYDDEETDAPQEAPETKRIKQESSKTSLNGAGTDKVHSSLEMDIDEKNSDLKPTCNIKESDQQKVNTVKSSAPPRERISARIRDLKSKKVAYKEEWVDPDQIRLSGQKIPVQSNKNSSSHEEITKTVTRKRKRKVQQNFQSMEDYVNESPLIQVGNLVGLRQCRLCAVMFVEKEQLMNHMKAVHHLDDKINITKEGATGVSQNDNKTHDEKPFKCSQCESSFRKSSGLKQHVTRQHSQNAPQKLPQAPSTQVSTKKSSAASDRPYACQVCGKAFKRKHHLQEHSYIHSDEKPYKCDTCSKTFNQRICLTKHLPCRELEKQQRKPSCSKTGDTTAGSVSTKQQPRDKVCSVKETEVAVTEVTEGGSKLTTNALSQSDYNANVNSSKTPAVKCHVNGNERDNNVRLLHVNGEPLRDKPVSQDTARHLEGRATNAVDSQESVADNNKATISGVSPSTSTENAVTTNDQACSVKKPTKSSQDET